MKKILMISGRVIVIAFALIGVFLTGGFFAVKWKLTNVSGVIDPDDRIFADLHLAKISGSVNGKNNDSVSPNDLCRLSVISGAYPENGAVIMKAIEEGASAEIVSSMIAAAERGISEKNPDVSEFIVDCDFLPDSKTPGNAIDWINTEEWRVFEEAVSKDASLINAVGKKTGVSGRLIVGELVGEQLRLFNSEREVFKKFFSPLKILGNETKFSLGVTGIKEETAVQIEKNLKDKTSVFYPGPEYENLLDFKTADVSQERVKRLTDKHDRYYPYLYTALFIKQIEAQWTRAGYDISDRPEIIGTLWNIGFKGSKPNPDPKAGGAVIAIGGKEYTFGSLVHGFYYSGRLISEFPYE